VPYVKTRNSYVMPQLERATTTTPEGTASERLAPR